MTNSALTVTTSYIILVYKNKTIYQKCCIVVDCRFCPLRGVPQTPTLRFSLKHQPKPRVLGYFDIHEMCFSFYVKNYVGEVIPYNREFHTQKSKNCLP